MRYEEVSKIAEGKTRRCFMVIKDVLEAYGFALRGGHFCQASIK